MLQSSSHRGCFEFEDLFGKDGKEALICFENIHCYR